MREENSDSKEELSSSKGITIHPEWKHETLEEAERKKPVINESENKKESLVQRKPKEKHRVQKRASLADPVANYSLKYSVNAHKSDDKETKEIKENLTIQTKPFKTEGNEEKIPLKEQEIKSGSSDFKKPLKRKQLSIIKCFIS